MLWKKNTVVLPRNQVSSLKDTIWFLGAAIICNIMQSNFIKTKLIKLVFLFCFTEKKVFCFLKERSGLWNQGVQNTRAFKLILVTISVI